jgi:NAD(P)H-hydrate epimerase
VKLVTSEEMREIDRRAIEDYGIPGIVLMENAGRAVAEAAEKLLGDSALSARVVVICGRGNNGGDGFVAARHLSNRAIDVDIYLLAAMDDLTGEAATNCLIAREMNLPIIENPEQEQLEAALESADLVIDAILGTGVSGEVHGAAGGAIEAINESAALVLAVDIPSGISGDTGAVLGDAVVADWTLTFGLPKIGHYCHPGRAHCGRIEVVDISLPAELITDAALTTSVTEAMDAWLMLPWREPDMHKGDAGRLLIVAGSEGMTGAAALAGLGAARSGAGLVTLGVPASLNDILEAKCTEVMTVPLPETEQRSLGREAAPQILDFAADCDAVALGPGISQVPATAELARGLIEQLDRPLVVDADGLNACAGTIEVLRGRESPTIITPHPGELSRLSGRTIPQIQADRVSAARQAAADLGCVVVLKGAASVTATSQGEVWVNPTGNAGMATGGVGDVLTGVIGALLAAGASAANAAASGVFYHGLAGDLAAEARGERGLVASDLLDRLPAAFAAQTGLNR